MPKNDRPTPAQCRPAEAKIASFISEIMVDRHGPGMVPIVEEVLELLWPATLQALKDTIEAKGGMRALETGDHPDLVKSAKKSDAALAIPGIGRIDLRHLPKSSLHDIAEGKHWLALRMHTRAVKELRDALEHVESESLFYAGE